MGFETAEVLRGCFCCRFPDLMRSARELVGRVRPEVIIAEPVGSCTDLQATVIAPLKIIHPNEFTVAPLIVLVDSSRLFCGDLDSKSIGAYLRKCQIEEGEYIVLSKTDMLSKSRLEDVKAAVRMLNPTAELIEYSALNGQGFESIVELVTSDRKSAGTPVQVDYDIYADAEAELGWYNGQVSFRAPRLDSYDLAARILRGVAGRYDPMDIAHIKIMLSSHSNALKVSAVCDHVSTDAAKGSRYAEGEVKLTINARIVSSPDLLRTAVREAVCAAMKALRVQEYDLEDDCYSPGRPNRTYRMTGS